MEVKPRVSPGTIALAIDVGTSNTCGYYYDGMGSGPQPLSFFNGSHILPSYVEYKADCINPIVGEVAKKDFCRHNRYVVANSKRLIGRRFRDENTQKFLTHCGVHVEECHGKPLYSIPELGVNVTPVDVVSEIIRAVSHVAEDLSGKRIDDLLITYPAHFDNNQRTATLNAAVKAGFDMKKVKMLNEPTAAAICYGLQNDTDNNCILVYDLGGGTFDVSILRPTKGGFEVETCDGDNALGGADFDQIIADWFENEYQRINHRPLDTLPSENIRSRYRRRLYAIAEEAKEQLLFRDEVDVDLSFMRVQTKDEQKGDVVFTRDTLNRLLEPLIEHTMEIVRRAMERIHVTKNDISHVVLVGGSSRLQLVVRKLEYEFGEEKLKRTVNPDECVAEGGCLALIYKYNIQERIAYSLGQLVKGGRILCVIPRWEALPAKFTATTKTSCNYMVRASTGVFQGKCEVYEQTEDIKDCIELESFTFDGFQCKREGEVEFDTTYYIQENGIVYVTIVEKKTGKVLLNNKMIQWQD